MTAPKKLSRERLDEIKQFWYGVKGEVEVQELLSHIAAIEAERDELSQSFEREKFLSKQYAESGMNTVDQLKMIECKYEKQAVSLSNIVIERDTLKSELEAVKRERDELRQKCK